MSDASIRGAFSMWPHYNALLREAVVGLTAEQLAVSPGPGRWPLWAVVGHLACQRVFWLCDFAGEPGAETTPFTDAADNCPGDDDLDHVLSREQLAAALHSTFAIAERCLDNWALASLDQEVRRTWGRETRVHTRGWVLQRLLAHDISHITEANETLLMIGAKQIDLWG